MNSHVHDYTSKVSRDKEKNIVTIEGEVSEVEFGKFVKQEIDSIKKTAELPGFRKGSVPEKMIVQRYGMKNILESAAEETLSHIYEHILEVEDIKAVGAPEVTITKIAEKNPLGFKISVPVLPEIKNFDYSPIAKKNNAKIILVPEVTPDEVENVIKEIRKNRAPKKDAPGTEVEFNDDFVKTLGDFKNVDDFKNKVKENLKKEKEYKEGEKKRIELFEALVKEADISVPETLIASEQNRLLAEFKNNIASMGITWEDYLKHSKKTEEEMKREWRGDAEKRASVEIILDHIAEKENIKPDSNKVDEEVGHLISHHKDLDPVRAEIYVSDILTRQAVIEFLEGLK